MMETIASSSIDELKSVRNDCITKIVKSVEKKKRPCKYIPKITKSLQIKYTIKICLQIYMPEKYVVIQNNEIFYHIGQKNCTNKCCNLMFNIEFQLDTKQVNTHIQITY